MTIIQGVKIHPGFFKKQRTKPIERRIGDVPSISKIKPTVINRPTAPRAKYAMPVVAIIGAIGSFVAGATIATAATATIGAMIVGGAMMVGAAMTVVGTITGNAKLTKLGGILSIAGGIGALGLGAAGMLTTGVDSVAAAGVGAGAESAGSAAAGGVTGADVIAADGNLINAGATATDALSGAAGSGAANVASSGLLTTPPPVGEMGVAGEIASTATPQAMTPSAHMPVANQPLTPLSGGSDVESLAANNQGSGMLSMPTTGSIAPQAIAKPEAGLWSEFQDWYKKNPELAKTLSSTVSGALNAMSPANAAQADYYRANTDLAKANAARTDEETYRLWLRTYYNQGKMPPSGVNPPAPRG